MPEPDKTMNVLPWDIEVLEDIGSRREADLRRLLEPPVIWRMPVLPLARTKPPISRWVLFFVAMAFGFACAAGGFFAVVLLAR